MSDHLPDLDKIPTVLTWLGGIGVVIGGAIMGILGYRRSKTPDESEAAAHADPRDAEIARLTREVEHQRQLTAIEAVMKATREAIYFKLDQGFAGVRGDITSARAQIGAQIEDAKTESEDTLKDVAKRLEDLERGRRAR